MRSFKAFPLIGGAADVGLAVLLVDKVVDGVVVNGTGEVDLLLVGGRAVVEMFAGTTVVGVDVGLGVVV